MPVTADSVGKSFLGHFPLNWQGVLTSRFRIAYQDGKRTPAALCSEVWRDAKDRVAFHAEHGYPTNNDELLKAKMEEDRQGALAFAEHVIEEQQAAPEPVERQRR